MSIVTLNKINQEAADRVETFLKKRPVAFIGAGMSLPKYPLWEDLIDQLAAKLGIARTTGPDLLEQAELFFAGSKDAYQNELESAFGNLPEDCRIGLKEMVKLSFASFITTNYDYSISRAYQETQLTRDEIEHHRYPDVEPIDCQHENRVFFLHGAANDDGSIDNLDHFVLHRSAYLKAYFSDKGEGHAKLSSFFYNLFGMYDVLFVGFGFSKEEPLVEVLQIANRSRGKKFARMMLRPMSISKEEIEHYQQHYGIEVVPYDPLDDSHRGLDDLFVHLREKRIGRPRFTSSLAEMNRKVTNLDQ
jgi:hypothetical protein